MNNSLIKTLAALAVAFTISNLAKADPITGSIGLTGIPTFSIPNDPADSTSVAFGSGAVLTGSGTFASIPFLTTATFSGVADAGTFANLPSGSLTETGSDLWSVTSGGDIYSFTATSIFGTSPQSNNWEFTGSGYFAVTDLALNPIAGPSLGTFSLNFSQSGTSLTFQTTAAVPDSGSSALLVGLGIVGLGVYAARRGKLVRA
jgi:hypothetical protein